MHVFICLSANKKKVLMHFFQFRFLGVFASPGQNYRGIGFLLVLGKICMSKKRIKRIDPKTNVQAGQHSASTLYIYIEHIHCAVGQLKMICLKRNCEPFLFLLHQLSANCFWWLKHLKLNYYIIRLPSL